MTIGTTDFEPFATAPGANVLDQADWAALPALQTGFSAGIANSGQLNKAWRQGLFGSATLFNWIISQIAVNQADDGNLANAVSNLNAALTTLIAAQNGHFFSFNGNPNTHVAGTAGVAGVSPPDLCEDTSTGHLWVCTTSGNAGAAVWSLGASSGVTQVTAGTGLSGGNITSTGTIALTIAGNSTGAIGGVKVDGSSITINGNGTISSTNAGGSINPSGNVTTNDFAVWASGVGTTLKDVPAANLTQICTGTDNFSPTTSLSLAIASAWQTLTDSSTTAWDLTKGFNARWTLGGNRTLGAPSSPIDGRTYLLRVIQPGSGGPCTVTWPASFFWGGAGAPSLSSGAGVADLVSLVYDSAASQFVASFNRGS